MTDKLILVPFQMLIAQIRGSRGDVSFRRTLRGRKGVYLFYIDALPQGIRCSVILNRVCVCNDADFINLKEVADFLEQSFLADFTKEASMPAPSTLDVEPDQFDPVAATLEDQAIAFAQRAWSEGFTLAEAKLALSPGLSSAQYIQVAESFTASCINYLGVQLEFNKPVKGK